MHPRMPLAFLAARTLRNYMIRCLIRSYFFLQILLLSHCCLFCSVSCRTSGSYLPQTPPATDTSRAAGGTRDRTHPSAAWPNPAWGEHVLQRRVRTSEQFSTHRPCSLPLCCKLLPEEFDFEPTTQSEMEPRTNPAISRCNRKSAQR